NMAATDGMVVHTQTERVLETRKSIMEFHLVNHPLDCPVCDQAGECWLQIYYMKHGLYDPRMVDEKVHKPKAVPLGPHVILDAERCILCSRCVRFCDEVTGTGELGIFNRGDHSEIGLFPGATLENKYSGNVVDICPVGALTDRDFRFQCRVWYLSETDSVCPGCSRGCNISIHSNRERHHHAEGRRVMRLKPRYNAEVNQWWMCDIGRYGYKSIDDPSRISVARVKKNGEFLPMEIGQAVAFAAEQLKQALETAGRTAVTVVASPRLTNEDLFVIKRFFVKDLGIARIGFQVPDPTPSSGDGLLLQADRNPNTWGAVAILAVDNGFDFFHSLENQAPVKPHLLYLFEHDLVRTLGEARAAKFLQQFSTVTYLGSNENETSALADLILPIASYAETDGTFTNFEGRLQRINRAVEPLGDSVPTWSLVSMLAQSLGYDYHYDSAEEVFED